MIESLRRAQAKQAQATPTAPAKAKPVVLPETGKNPAAPAKTPEALTTAPIAPRWSDPDPGCYVAHKPSPAAPQASPSTLDAKMVAKLKAAVRKQPVIA